MPAIMPVKALRGTTKISETAYKLQEPIFIIKNGYRDLVVMSAELYDYFADINRIGQAIKESGRRQRLIPRCRLFVPNLK